MSLHLEDHIFRVLENQFRLYQFLGKHNWAFNMDEGQLTFTNAETGQALASCPVQILGTESTELGTWLWAWANTASEIPDRLLSGVRKVKEAGERAEQLEFMSPSLKVSYERMATELAIVATGHLGLFTYYACGYDGGAMYAAVESCPEVEGTPRDGLLVNRIIFTSLSALDFNHRQAVHAYLGDPAEMEGDEGVWSVNNDGVRIRFDSQDRVTRLEVVARPK